MSSRLPSPPLIAADVGNSRIKLGWFQHPTADRFLQPDRTLELEPAADHEERLVRWLEESAGDAAPPARVWAMASVNRHAAAWLSDAMAQVAPEDEMNVVGFQDLPLVVDLPAPERVGIDRLLGAVAANKLRDADQPAIIVDVGTAITVDLVSTSGRFCGGAIMPGIGMAARALDQQTDLLPTVPLDALDSPPPPLGTDTQSAIGAGLFWGAVGGIRELVTRLRGEQTASTVLMMTGGAAPSVARLFDPPLQFIPHLVLGGIAIAHATRRS